MNLHWVDHVPRELRGPPGTSLCHDDPQRLHVDLVLDDVSSIKRHLHQLNLKDLLLLEDLLTRQTT